MSNVSFQHIKYQLKRRKPCFSSRKREISKKRHYSMWCRSWQWRSLIKVVLRFFTNYLLSLHKFYGYMATCILAYFYNFDIFETRSSGEIILWRNFLFLYHTLFDRPNEWMTPLKNFGNFIFDHDMDKKPCPNGEYSKSDYKNVHYTFNL